MCRCYIGFYTFHAGVHTSYIGLYRFFIGYVSAYRCYIGVYSPNGYLDLLEAVNVSDLIILKIPRGLYYIMLMLS